MLLSECLSYLCFMLSCGISGINSVFLCFSMLLSTVFYLVVIFYCLFSQTLFQRGDTLSATLGHVIFLFPIYSPLGKSFCIFHWNKWWIEPFVEQATVIQQFHSKWEDKTKSKQIQQRLEEGKPPNNWFKLINTLKDSCQNNVAYIYFFFQKELKRFPLIF